MITDDLILRQLVPYHEPSFYNEPNGTFSSKGRAALVAECLRKLLANADLRLRDSRFVTTEGRFSACYVFVPRLQHQWHPRMHATDIEAEARTIINELLKDLTT